MLYLYKNYIYGLPGKYLRFVSRAWLGICMLYRRFVILIIIIIIIITTIIIIIFNIIIIFIIIFDN